MTYKYLLNYGRSVDEYGRTKEGYGPKCVGQSEQQKFMPTEVLCF